MLKDPTFSRAILQSLADNSGGFGTLMFLGFRVWGLGFRACKVASLLLVATVLRLEFCWLGSGG